MTSLQRSRRSPAATSPAHNARRRFAARIIQLRKERAWSQADLAQASGISARSIFNIEKGVYSITLDSILKLARGFQLRPRDLFET